MTGDQAISLKKLKVDSKSDAAKSQNSLRFENSKLILEIGAAIGEFGGKWFVNGRSAADRYADVSVNQGEAVIPVYRMSLIRKVSLMKRVKEEVAGTISSESAASAVPAVSGRREPENQKLRARITEPRHGPAPVVPILKRSALGSCDRLSVLNQARALAAGDDFPIKQIQLISGSSHLGMGKHHRRKLTPWQHAD